MDREREGELGVITMDKRIVVLVGGRNRQLVVVFQKALEIVLICMKIRSLFTQGRTNAYPFSTQYHVRLISCNVDVPRVPRRSRLDLSARWSDVQPI